MSKREKGGWYERMVKILSKWEDYGAMLAPNKGERIGTFSSMKSGMVFEEENAPGKTSANWIEMKVCHGHSIAEIACWLQWIKKLVFNEGHNLSLSRRKRNNLTKGCSICQWLSWGIWWD